MVRDGIGDLELNVLVQKIRDGINKSFSETISIVTARIRGTART
jgi:hypothetical protein